MNKQTAEVGRGSATHSPNMVCIRLARAYRSLADFLEEGSIIHGVSPADFTVLEALLHEGPLPADAITSNLGQFSNGSSSRIVDRLSRRGLIRRQSRMDRSVEEVLELTEEGRKEIARLYGAHEGDIQAVMGVLSEQEQNQLRRLLKKIGLRSSERQPTRPKDLRAGLAPWQMRRVTDYMADRIAHPAHLKDLAAQTGLSVSQFRRAFKLSMGISPHRWQMNRRILEAQELLRQGELSLAEISLRTGFAEQSHFQRVFKRIAGISPGAWQRQHRV